jgi:hypothetical protein
MLPFLVMAQRIRISTSLVARAMWAGAVLSLIFATLGRAENIRVSLPPDLEGLGRDDTAYNWFISHLRGRPRGF